MTVRAQKGYEGQGEFKCRWKEREAQNPKC